MDSTIAMVRPTRTTWIGEHEAATMLGYSSLPRFRRNVKQRKITINFRSTNNRLFQYCLEDIRRFQKETSFGSSEKQN